MPPPNFIQRIRNQAAAGDGRTSYQKQADLDEISAMIRDNPGDVSGGRVVPRTADNPFLRAADDLGARWEEMRQERDEAVLASERDRQENLRLSERVDALERELSEKVAFLVGETAKQTERADVSHGKAEALRAKFSVIAQALLHVMRRDDAESGGVYRAPPPIEDQALASAIDHAADVEEVSELLNRMPPNNYPGRTG